MKIDTVLKKKRNEIIWILNIILIYKDMSSSFSVHNILCVLIY